MVKPGDIAVVFPFTLADYGLPYEEPDDLCIVDVMRKVVVMIEENKGLLLDMENKACIITKPREVEVHAMIPKPNGSIRELKKIERDPVPLIKTKSIRVMTMTGAKSGQKAYDATAITSISSQLKKQPIKRGLFGIVPTTSDERNTNKKTKASFDSQHPTIIKSQNVDLSNESVLSAMTCVELFQLCDHYKLDIPKRSKKSFMVDSLLKHGMERVHRSNSATTTSSGPAVHSVNSSATSSMNLTKTISQLFREETKDLKSSLLNEITTQIHNVSKTPTYVGNTNALAEHDELIATRATLQAMLEQKQDSKETFKEHLNMFKQVSEIAKDPLMESIKLHSEQMVSLSSSNLQLRQQQSTSIALPQAQLQHQSIYPPSCMQYAPHQRFFEQHQFSRMMNPWHQQHHEQNATVRSI